MISNTEFTTTPAKILEANALCQSMDGKNVLNKPTGDFFYDPWEILPEYKGTVFEELLAPLKDIGEARIIKQIKKIDAERPKANLGNFMPVDKTPPTKQGTLNFGSPKPKEPAPFNQTIYHGGPAGIETLRTPKLILDDQASLSKSTGGIYSVLDKTDPRLKLFGYSPPTRREDMLEYLTPAMRQELTKDLPKKSIYKISPEFKNIADAENLPPDFIEELIKIRDNINVFKGNPYDQALSQNTRNTLELMTESPKVGAPSMINKPVGDIFRGAGYDSILFPPRKLMRDESKTVLSLDG